MQKFSRIDEAKYFTPDPSIIKKYAAFVIPLYLNGKIKCDEVLMDEYLELYKKAVKYKNANVICDLEVAAIKLVIQENPMTAGGYEQFRKEIENKCPKLEKFLKSWVNDPKTYS